VTHALIPINELAAYREVNLLISKLPYRVSPF
jgi:hypothetical protein